ncbi:MAG: protein-export chaperone SecB [Porticoccaceae bacterium]
MSQENNTNGGDVGSAQKPTLEFAIERIYLKDISFEVPQGAESFRKQWQPRITQDVLTKVNKIGEDHYEVVLQMTVGVKEEEQTAYLVEVQQAGVFLVRGLEGEQLAHLLNSHCPTILFPYAREVVDSVVTKGSFPPPMLPPINFEALFQQAIKKARDSGTADGRTDGGVPSTH